MQYFRSILKCLKIQNSPFHPMELSGGCLFKESNNLMV